MEPASSHLNVVLVDDDPEVRRSVGRLLKACACAVNDFANGVDALAHVAHHGADLVVTDLEMPEMDGAQLVAHIQAGGFDGALVMLSGQTAARCDERLGAVGAAPIHAVLEKPLSLDAVRRLIAGVRARPVAGPVA